MYVYGKTDKFVNVPYTGHRPRLNLSGVRRLVNSTKVEKRLSKFLIKKNYFTIHPPKNLVNKKKKEVILFNVYMISFTLFVYIIFNRYWSGWSVFLVVVRPHKPGQKIDTHTYTAPG